MVAKEELKKYKGIASTNEIIDKKECTSEAQTKVHDAVLLFFSFDIVNSSLYKTINYYGWSIVIDYILNLIRKTVSSKINDVEVWRIFGDEIIFIVKLAEQDVLYEYIEKIYKILIFCCEQIDDGSIFEEMQNFSDAVTGLMKVQNVISLQASAWIAIVADKRYMKQTRYVENIFEVIEYSPNNKFFEFIGIDIDTGFRLSKETRARRLVVSFELAYLLLNGKENEEKYADRLYIITYRKLKGVWNNMVYPIIWYYDDSENDGVNFEDSMPFDAVHEDRIYAEYLNREQSYAEYMYTDVKKALEKICNDRKLKHKIDTMKEILAKPILHSTYIKNTLLELHCVAVCYHESKGILIVKRSNNRKWYPGKWEFGCAKATYESDLITTIQNDYEKDFNIKIKLIIDKNRKDSQPEPLAVYEIEKGSELHKGIIFLARIESGTVLLNEKKHEQYKFVKDTEWQKLKNDEFVPDAINTLKKAFEKIMLVEGGKDGK